MKNKKYKIFLKGWGDFEEGWYPQARGNSVEEVKKKIFNNCENKYAEYRIVIENTSTIVEEGIFKEGAQ